MLGLFLFIFEVKKEFLFGLSLSILYITYYLVEVVKRPVLVCGAGALRAALEARVPLVRERYWPTPWCVEARLQTVLGSLLRSRWLPPPAFRREVLRLRDGGQVALDWREAGAAPGEARPVLLVLPGLTGGAHADYVRCLSAAARQLRAHLVVFSNRGLGGVPLTTPRLYCAVSHSDLAEVVAAVRARHAGPLLAAGVSLGGLILGQYLARWGGAARVQAALLVSAPLDVPAGAACMERARNAPLARHMAGALRRTLRAHPCLARAAACPRVHGARSLRQFDAAFTARHFGFESVDAYYAAATLRGKLARVRVPLLCLCAADDPFQPADVLPLREVAGSARVALLLTARGGHIGFLEGWWPARAAHTQYMARLAAQYFAALLDEPALLHRPAGPDPADPDTDPAQPGLDPADTDPAQPGLDPADPDPAHPHPATDPDAPLAAR